MLTLTLIVMAALNYRRRRQERDLRYIVALQVVTTKIRSEYEVD